MNPLKRFVLASTVLCCKATYFLRFFDARVISDSFEVKNKSENETKRGVHGRFEPGTSGAKRMERKSIALPKNTAEKQF